MADPAQLDARPVMAHGLFHAPFDGVLIAPFFHVDEIDHDQAGEIAQAQLAGDFAGRLQIGLDRRFLDIAFARGAAGVDVDGDQRFGLIDDDIAARAQPHDGAVHGVQLRLDLVALEQRHAAVAVRLHLLGMARHDHAHEAFGGLIAVLALDRDFVQIAGVEVADRAFDQAGFLMDQGRRLGRQRVLADLVPQAQEIFVIAFDFGLGALAAGGAHDHRHFRWHLELADNRLEALAVGRIGDFAADPATTRGVRHQHTITAGQRQIGGQGGALVAAFLFDHLHQHDLAAGDHLLDFVAARDLAAAAHHVVDGVAADRFRLRLVAFILAALAIGGGLGVFGDGLGGGVLGGGFRLLKGGVVVLQVAGGGLFGDQRLAVLDRDAVIVGVDFVKGQKAMAIAAIFHERGLQGRLDPGDPRQINITLELFF